MPKIQMSLKLTKTDLQCVGTYNPIYTVGVIRHSDLVWFTIVDVKCFVDPGPNQFRVGKESFTVEKIVSSQCKIF